MTPESVSYNIATIRELLLAAFTADDLRRFCQDRPRFRPIVDRFGPSLGKDGMVDRVIEYCETQLLFRELLQEIEKANPRQYARFRDHVHTTDDDLMTADTTGQRMRWDESQVPQLALVKYRDVVKLMHFKTGRALHSHRILYQHPETSGQQQVTAYHLADNNDYWIIKARHEYPEEHSQGIPIKHGDVVRFEHLLTRKNLHSHAGHPSPITRQQEVTAYGENGIGDTNDNWRVEIEGSEVWETTRRVRLIHINTNAALHSHEGAASPYYTAGQQEVTCHFQRDDNDWWRAAIRT